MRKLLRLYPRSISKKRKEKRGGSGQTGLQSGPGRVPGRRCRVGLRHPGRPRPDTRPARSGRGPVPRPAQAGPQAGAAGWAAGSRAGPGRVAGRLPLPGVLPLPLAGSQAGPGRGAGRPGCCLLLLSFSNGSFWSLLFKGFLPQNEPDLFANS